MIRGDVYIGDLLAELDASADPAHTRDAVMAAGQFLRAVWIDLAHRHSASGSYIHGIQEPEPLANGLAVEVVNTAPHAAVIELGHGAYHLPSKIHWAAAPRVKVSAKGVRYLTIPFRHFTPQGPASGPTLMAQRAMMPAKIYAMAKDLAASSSMAGPMMPGARRTGYQWGDRLDLSRKLRQAPTMKSPLGVELATRKPHWVTSKFQGMVRFEQVSPDNKSRSSTYLTFRTLTESSPNWNIPPLEGQHYTRQVLSPENVARVRQIVAKGVMRDLAGFRGGNP